MGLSFKVAQDVENVLPFSKNDTATVLCTYMSVSCN